jgi:S1-C subfamily serine protease
VGVVVVSVAKDTPAAKSGLHGISQGPEGIRMGDIIVGIGKERVENYDDLYNGLDKYKVGDLAEVHVKRGDKVEKISIELIKVQ